MNNEEFAERHDSGPDPRTIALTASVVPLLAAAVLLVIAPFRTLIGYGFGGSIQSLISGFQSYTIDGWGRLHGATATGVHAPRYGIVLVAVGTAYALLAAAVVATFLAGAANRRYLDVIGRLILAITGVLAGSIAVGALQVSSALDGARISFQRQAAGAKLEVSIGACAWLSVVALGLGVIAVAAIRWLPSYSEPAAPEFEALERRQDELEDESEDDAESRLGRLAPHVVLASTSGRSVALDQLPPGRTIVYVYPLTARPGVDLPPDWDDIPGARGCTPESCGFRDHHTELLAAGAIAVFGLSAQTTEYQLEVVQRLQLPFEILSDPQCQLADPFELATFTTDGARHYRRVTLVLRDGRVEHVFSPIADPAAHAEEVLNWLRDNPPETPVPDPLSSSL